MYHVYREFQLNSILSLIGSSKERIQLDGYLVNVTSLRLLTLKRSQVCCKCGREGHVFRLESSRKTDPYPHLNMYHITSDNRLILMTKDHIIPKSLGGPDTLANTQTMCTECNREKDTKIDLENISNSDMWYYFFKRISSNVVFKR